MPGVETAQQPTPATESTEEKPAEEKEAPAPKPVVGIIYPPPEVRNIVDKTADFVARNGLQFQERIRLNEAGNTKFNFLNPTDPYHAYYMHKINEIREGKVVQDAAQKTVLKSTAPVPLMPELEVPNEPPPEWEFIVDPPSISAVDLDIVKLTAQFVAKNGTSFLERLMQKEQRSYQFDFLRKHHPLFSYFTKLVEQYSKVLLPSRDLKAKLHQEVENPYQILDHVKVRVDWTRFQDRIKKREQEVVEKERLEYSSIGWHDFVVVETINFRDNETGFLPAPIAPTQLAARLLAQQKYERIQEEGGDVQEIEMEVEEETDTEKEEAKAREARKKPEREASPPPPGAVQPPPIVKNYDPKAPKPVAAAPIAKEQFLISPITGERVPASKMADHMRYGLLDPRWREQQNKQVGDKKQQDEIFAVGGQIGPSLKNLAERRTDIFGSEETAIGRKINEEEMRRPDVVQWDGHSASIAATQKAAQSKITVEDQIKAIQEAHGLLSVEPNIGPKIQARSSAEIIAPPKPPSMTTPLLGTPGHISAAPPVPPPSSMTSTPPSSGSMTASGLLPIPFNAAPPVMPTAGSNFPPPMMMGEEPFAKRLKMDLTDGLIPEQQFIAQHPGSVTFKVQVPVVLDKPEWKLNGQQLTITLPITDPVSVIKARVADELGMPTGKQKLQIGMLFIKDSNSLGFYNVTSSTMVQLGLKERGGRKK
ncbi:splicing factor 3A subunit 1-like [Dysidea avara]|uniref:splicing factor 3A subunit 1-like n=1 Tax=Dysidea avara TaxID=196820 RepID=UPI003331EE1E